MAAEPAWFCSQFPAQLEPTESMDISVVFVTIETKDNRDRTREEEGESEEHVGY